jgi:hypothetical protein
MFLKNTITNDIGQFANHQGEGWVELTESEILAYELQEAKTSKIKEIKAWRDAELVKPTPQSVDSYDIDDAPSIGNYSFKFAPQDIAHLNSIINKLNNSPSGATRKWTSITGERVPLTKKDYESILSHLDARDENSCDIAQANIDIVNSLTSVEEVESYEIELTFE